MASLSSSCAYHISPMSSSSRSWSHESYSGLSYSRRQDCISCVMILRYMRRSVWWWDRASIGSLAISDSYISRQDSCSSERYHVWSYSTRTYSLRYSLYLYVSSGIPYMVYYIGHDTSGKTI
jgi:hypothetical protein